MNLLLMLLRLVFRRVPDWVFDLVEVAVPVIGKLIHEVTDKTIPGADKRAAVVAGTVEVLDEAFDDIDGWLTIPLDERHKIIEGLTLVIYWSGRLGFEAGGDHHKIKPRVARAMKRAGLVTS